MPFPLLLALFIGFLLWLYVQRLQEHAKSQANRRHRSHQKPAPAAIIHPTPPVPVRSQNTKQSQFRTSKNKVHKYEPSSNPSNGSPNTPMPPSPPIFQEPPPPLAQLPPAAKPLFSENRRSKVEDEYLRKRTEKYTQASSTQAVSTQARPIPMPTREMRQIGFKSVGEMPEYPPPRIQRHQTGYVFQSRRSIDNVSNSPNQSKVISRPSALFNSNLALSERNVSNTSFEENKTKGKRNQKPLTKYER